MRVRCLTHTIGAALGAALLSVWAAEAQAQVKPITDAGVSEGLPPEVVNFEPEYRERSKVGIGVARPAPAGTPPGSTDPRNIAGIWIHSRAWSVDAAPTSEVQRAVASSATPAAAAAAAKARATAETTKQTYVGGGTTRAASQSSCRPRGLFSIGMPGRIVQTPAAIYILKNSMDGTSYRRIAMGGNHPAGLQPSINGDSIGHWEGDTLVIDTVGLKGPISTGDLGPARGVEATPNTRVTERIHKIENNMTLENMLTIEDPALKQPVRARVISFWRPDLHFVEAPCEEYSDPLETELSGPFQGGDEPRATRPPE
jgi:hypothetical protein